MNQLTHKPKASAQNLDGATGVLVLVATPIGNMEDITTRAVNTLRECDIIAAEDTRITQSLLRFHGLKKRIISCFDANEETRAREIVDHCLLGEIVALVTSRGHPSISDPGYRVVCAALEAGVKVTVVPGANAAISALALSGFPTNEFHFHGFLPRKGKKRRKQIQLISMGGTHIIYESPERITDTLKEITELCGNPRAALARELTKLYEETIRGNCVEIIEIVSKREVLGELTLIVHVDAAKSSDVSADIAQRGFEMKKKLGMSTKDAAEAMSIAFDVKKSKAYEILLELDKSTTSQ